MCIFFMRHFALNPRALRGLSRAMGVLLQQLLQRITRGEMPRVLVWAPLVAGVS
jgi:hypothetical protein